MLLLAAASMGNEASRAPVALSVKPSLCITDERHQSCEMSLLVLWESDTAGSYCLYSELEPDPVGCWSNRSSGRIEESRIVESSFLYWLADGDPETRLAEARVEVMSADSDDRRRSRRRRHAWSIL